MHASAHIGKINTILNTRLKHFFTHLQLKQLCTCKHVAFNKVLSTYWHIYASVYIYIYIYIYIIYIIYIYYIYIYTNLYTLAHTYTHTYIHIYIHIYFGRSKNIGYYTTSLATMLSNFASKCTYLHFILNHLHTCSRMHLH